MITSSSNLRARRKIAFPSLVIIISIQGFARISLGSNPLIWLETPSKILAPYFPAVQFLTIVLTTVDNSPVECTLLNFSEFILHKIKDG